jgi:hypothetical protein
MKACGTPPAWAAVSFSWSRASLRISAGVALAATWAAIAGSSARLTSSRSRRSPSLKTGAE